MTTNGTKIGRETVARIVDLREREEPFGAIVAMMSTQEGQQPALNAERTLPAFAKYHALEVAEIAVKTRWACMNDVYRVAVPGQPDPLPAGVEPVLQGA